MRARLDANGAIETLLDRSEPLHVESLVALGQLERARDVLDRLQERGRRLPRMWIDVTLPRARALVLAADGDLAGALEALDELDIVPCVAAAVRARLCATYWKGDSTGA